MAFVIRSMSTTNYTTAYRDALGILIPAQQPRPYHVYLRPVSKRTGAYWAGIYEAMTFGSETEALEEIERCALTSCDVAPVDHEARGLPAYWEARA